MGDDVLKKYQSEIKQLKEHIGNKHFEAIFSDLTQQIKKSDQFLIKMELNRLKQPVNRFIDLRGLVDGRVEQYEHQGKLHYMDSIAIEVFESELKKYGAFTMGVFEAVNDTENNFRNIQQQIAEQAQKEPAEVDTDSKIPATKLVKFASYGIRQEERMNYSIKIQLKLNSGQSIEASTSDISVSGCKAKVAIRYQFESGQKVLIRFVGLEQDFELGLKDGIQYEVVAIEHNSETMNHIRLKRTYLEQTSSFDDFLRNFINGNKRRYKVNLDNTLDAVIIKGYEQFYLPRITSLPIFLVLEEGKLQPSLILKNENNVGVIQYFNDENRQLVLGSILNTARIKSILNQATGLKEAMLYCFTHLVQGKIFFYSATNIELNQTPALKDLFFGFGSKKASWRVFKLQLTHADWKSSHIPLSLPDSAGEEVKKMNLPPTPRVEGFIKPIQYQVLLTDLTHPEATEAYKQTRFNREQVNALKQFGHAKKAPDRPIDVIALEYVNLRSETRYLYKTDILLENAEMGLVAGTSRDFSEHGLQIEVFETVKLKKGDLVSIAFPTFQKMTKKYRLSQLPYEVQALSKTGRIINLRSYELGENSKHQGIEFFKELIDKNKANLKAASEGSNIPGLSNALRNMLVKNICQLPFYLNRHGAHYAIHSIGQGHYKHPFHYILSALKTADGVMQLAPLLGQHALYENILPKLKDMKRQDKPNEIDLYVRLDPKAQVAGQSTICSYIHADTTLKKRQEFIDNCLDKELFFSFRMYLSRTGRPDTDYLSKELSYISHYALHKAKVLEKELWSVTAVGDVIDTTEETLVRFGLTSMQQQIQRDRRTRWYETFPEDE